MESGVTISSDMHFADDFVLGYKKTTLGIFKLFWSSSVCNQVNMDLAESAIIGVGDDRMSLGPMK